MSDKAYSVMETDEYTGGIVFAKDKRTARRRGANIWADGEQDCVEVRRLPGLDKYHLTGVPAKELVWCGWHFECHGCGMKIEEDNMIDQGLPVDGVVGFEDGAIYCCHVCRMEHLSDKAARDAFGKAFLEMLRDVVRKRFPNIEHAFGEHKAHVCVHMGSPLSVIQARVGFSFPGMKIGPAHIDYHHCGQHGRTLIGPVRPEFWCCNGDREAFEAFSQPAAQEGGD
ncbi:MAG: hypothetical protein CMP09_06025 [Yangia sp.]|nr:hypothetical protein [Salipiger sp.]